MFYTKEQINTLEKYRKTFETAVHSGFARNVGSIALKEIEEVYDTAYGSHYSYNSGCSVCVLGFLKRVGEPFLKEAEIYRKKEERERQKAEEERNLPPDVEMRDGTITISFDRAEAEEAAIKAKAEQTKTEVVENVEVKEESLVFETAKTNAPEPPKTNKRTRRKKEDGTEQ